MEEGKPVPFWIVLACIIGGLLMSLVIEDRTAPGIEAAKKQLVDIVMHQKE